MQCSPILIKSQNVVSQLYYFIYLFVICEFKSVFVTLIFGMLCFLFPAPTDEMAVRQRIFNSTSPFSGSTQVELKGSYPSCSADQETEEEEEEGQDSKMDNIIHGPLINRFMTQGTAEQVGKMPLKTSTFIAQAECKLFS